ncbi:MAG: protein kinase [Kofleriaceae bacterium]|nr:protein kinase [Kofleriaceae bacterium]
MSTATVTCGNCRHEFAATALFCPHCGRAKVRELDGDVLLGKVLGERFLVLERIGHGASGTIYRAEHVTLRRKVAIKVLHHEMSRDELAVERFRREATTVADIDNEHIVEIHDFGRTPDGRLYLAMELLEGETLDAVLERGAQLPVDQVVDVLIQVGEALMEAHAIGYVHRDLRPRNIFLAVRRGRANFVKLLDFGLAKLVEKEGSAASTSLGMTFGDPRYMSPEQARGDAIDRRADVYQLGCVGYEMLTGAPPFVGGRVFDVLSRHVSEAPQPVSAARPDVPRWVEAAVLRMLAKAPDDRFATVSRMVEALRRGAQTGEIMGPDEAQVEEAEPPPSVSRVMQKLGRTQLGPHGDEAGAAGDVSDDAATRTLPRVGPRGTPKVGVPAVTAAGPAAAPVAAAPAHAAAPAQAQAHAAAAQVPDPASTSPGVGGVWARPGAVDHGHGVHPAYAPAPARAPSAPPAAAAAPAPPRPRPRPRARRRRASPAPPVVRDGSGSTGKLPGARQRRATDSAGISQVWFKDGEKLDGGEELDDVQAQRLERARRLIAPPPDESMSEVYAAVQRRPVGKILAIAGGALVLVVALVLILGGGDKHDGQRSAKATLPAPPVDAAPAVTAPVDAGVPDAAPAAPSSGSGSARTERTHGGSSGGSSRGGSSAGGSSGGSSGGGSHRTDPLDPVDPDGAGGGGGGGSGGGAADDEAKMQAEFFAKTGDAQLRGGDAQGAAANFKKALELDARNVGATVGLGEVAMQQGLYAAAITHLKKALKMSPGSSRAHTLLGECYLNTGKDEAAAAEFKTALKIDPDNARARDGFNEASNRLPPPQDDE